MTGLRSRFSLSCFRSLHFCCVIGDWKDSKRHGVGHLKLASGLVYSGEFNEDSIQGEGSLTLINGSLYNVSLCFASLAFPPISVLISP